MENDDQINLNENIDMTIHKLDDKTFLVHQEFATASLKRSTIRPDISTREEWLEHLHNASKILSYLDFLTNAELEHLTSFRSLTSDIQKFEPPYDFRQLMHHQRASLELFCSGDIDFERLSIEIRSAGYLARKLMLTIDRQYDGMLLCDGFILKSVLERINYQ